MLLNLDKVTYMKTRFISKRQAEKISQQEGSDQRVLISVTSPPSTRFPDTTAKLSPDTWGAVLRLMFHDVDPKYLREEAMYLQEGEEPVRYRLFNEEDAGQVIDFILQHRDVDEIIVHCEAGISRSAAISKFVAVLFNESFPDDYMLYNKHVFSTLMKVYHTTYAEVNLFGEQDE